MSMRGAIGAALAAMTVASRSLADQTHCEHSSSAFVAPESGTQTIASATPNSTRKVIPGAAAIVDPTSHDAHTPDIQRALAVMERYHSMAMEALHANTPPSATPIMSSDLETLPSATQSTDLCIITVHPESKQGVLHDKPVEPADCDTTHTSPLSSVPSVEDHSQASSTPASPSSPGANTHQSPTTSSPLVSLELSKPKPRKSRLPRVPASQLYRTITDGGDLCVPLVIVGGGTAAWSAVQAIRKRDPTASVLVITEETYYPYNRTPLSKDLWAPSAAGLFTSEVGTRNALEYSYAAVDPAVLASRKESDTVSSASEPALESKPIMIIRGTPAVDLDPDAKTVTLSGGRKVQYEKLLIATGGTPRAPDTVCEALQKDGVRENVNVLRTIGDFRELRDRLGPVGSSVAVIGGGFLGTELAVAMSSEGRNVTLLCAEPGVLYKVLPRYLSEFLSGKLSALGINVVGSAIVTNADRAEGGKTSLVINGTSDQTVLAPVDKIVVAAGLTPRVELASRAGLELDERNGGIVVNDQMMAEADVWAAGDVASFWDRALGRRRIEHWDHAVVSGRIAGDRMAGGNSRYGLQSMFWSDLDNVGVRFSAVGCVDRELETIGVWNLDAPPFEHAPSANSYTGGVVWYIRSGVVVGAVLWNLHGKKHLDAARQAISAKQRITEDTDLDKLVGLPESAYRSIVRTPASIGTADL